MGQDAAVNQPSHVLNQAVGLLVFLAGVALLALVFWWAYRLYDGLDASLLGVQAGPVRPAVSGLVPAAPLPSGTLTARPEARVALSPLALVLVAKLLVLLVMGWIGGLIASKGIGLATGPPRATPPPAG